MAPPNPTESHDDLPAVILDSSAPVDLGSGTDVVLMMILPTDAGDALTAKLCLSFDDESRYCWVQEGSSLSTEEGEWRCTDVKMHPSPDPPENAGGRYALVRLELIVANSSAQTSKQHRANMKASD